MTNNLKYLNIIFFVCAQMLQDLFINVTYEVSMSLNQLVFSELLKWDLSDQILYVWPNTIM